MALDPKILTAASDLMSRLESSGALSLPGLDVKKAGDKYVIKDAELPRLAIEAVLLDVLGSNFSILKDEPCAERHTDERLAFLGLEGQPSEVLALFARRAENLSAKLANLSDYEKDDRDLLGWMKSVTVPLTITGSINRGLIFRRNVTKKGHLKVHVFFSVKYENFCPPPDVPLASTVHPRKRRNELAVSGMRGSYPPENCIPRGLKATNEYLVGPKFTRKFSISLTKYGEIKGMGLFVPSWDEVVYQRGSSMFVDPDKTRVGFSEHDFLRLLANDAITRKGDTSELPELFESINIKTVSEKLR